MRVCLSGDNEKDSRVQVSNSEEIQEKERQTNPEIGKRKGLASIQLIVYRT